MQDPIMIEYEVTLEGKKVAKQETAAKVLAHWVWRDVEIFVVTGAIEQMFRRHEHDDGPTFEPVLTFVKYAGCKEAFFDDELNLTQLNTNDMSVGADGLHIWCMNARVRYEKHPGGVRILKSVRPTWKNRLTSVDDVGQEYENHLPAHIQPERECVEATE